MHLETATPSTGGAKQSTPLIELGADAFTPWRIKTMTHHLSGHPLLQLDALQGLGARLEEKGSIRTHANTAKAGTPFNSAPDMFPNTKSAVDTLRSLADANAWMSLLNVQIDPVYRALVAEVLDSIRPQIDLVDPGMCHRAGWIFVSSPNTVTPYHFDKEHNFLMQIHGRKRVYVWDHDDLVVASEHARNLFHHSHERYLLRWRDEFRERAHVFEVGPGEGVYMPSTSPHMVENGDGPSITMSFTYYTNSTRRDSMLHRSRVWMRRLGVTPPRVGQRPAFDTLTHSLASRFSRSQPVFDFAEVPQT